MDRHLAHLDDETIFYATSGPIIYVVSFCGEALKSFGSSRYNSNYQCDRCKNSQRLLAFQMLVELTDTYPDILWNAYRRNSYCFSIEMTEAFWAGGARALDD